MIARQSSTSPSIGFLTSIPVQSHTLSIPAAAVAAQVALDRWAASFVATGHSMGPWRVIEAPGTTATTAFCSTCRLCAEAVAIRFLNPTADGPVDTDGYHCAGMIPGTPCQGEVAPAEEPDFAEAVLGMVNQRWWPGPEGARLMQQCSDELARVGHSLGSWSCEIPDLSSGTRWFTSVCGRCGYVVVFAYEANGAFGASREAWDGRTSCPGDPAGDEEQGVMVVVDGIVLRLFLRDGDLVVEGDFGIGDTAVASASMLAGEAAAAGVHRIHWLLRGLRLAVVHGAIGTADQLREAVDVAAQPDPYDVTAATVGDGRRHVLWTLAGGDSEDRRLIATNPEADSELLATLAEDPDATVAARASQTLAERAHRLTGPPS